jgi:nucleotide-binding universal stress UspA family protein
MNRSVLLPTDFSESALNAIRYALGLYQHMNCDFYFLNVFTVNGYSIDNMMVPEPGDAAYEASKIASEKGLEMLLEVLEKEYDNPKHTYHTIATYNSLLFGIKDTIAKKDIEIIVMGTKGATAAAAVLYGTNAVDVMEHISECPVLAIPSGFHFSPPKEVVLATNYKTGFKRRELNNLIEILSLNKAAIRILHILEEPELSKRQESNLELLKEILKGTTHSFHTLKEVKVHAGINAFIESRGSDMLAFMHSKHGFFRKLFAKPLVAEMGYHSKIPLLAIHQMKS